MAHLVRDKVKLLNRVRRIRGQIEAVERALEEEADCGSTMRLIAAARGAMNSLMAEVVEAHVRFHMIDPDRHPTSAEAEAGQELIDVVKAYVK
jgi:FrmR/RcnR family transcriptional regulator, repressor of frmRAB operon